MQLDAIERLNLTISAGAIAVGYASGSTAFAASLALGAAIEALNFRALRRGSERLFSGNSAVSFVWVAGAALRFLVLGGVISLSLHAGAHPVGLVLGLSTIVPATIMGAWLQRPPIATAEPGPSTDDPSWDSWNSWLARERDPAEGEER